MPCHALNDGKGIQVPVAVNAVVDTSSHSRGPDSTPNGHVPLLAALTGKKYMLGLPSWRLATRSGGSCTRDAGALSNVSGTE